MPGRTFGRSRATLWLVAMLLAGHASAAPVRPGTDVIADRIRDLNRQLSAGSVNADTVRERGALLHELLAANPLRALSLALASELTAQLRSLAADLPVETEGEWEGEAFAVTGDNFEARSSFTQWYLRTPGGQLEVFFAGPAPSGGQMKLRGLRILDRIAVAKAIPQPLSTDTGATLPCATTGQQNVAVIMVTMPSVPAFPSVVTPASLRQSFFGSASDTHATDSLNGYWRQMSYGTTSAAGQVFGPFALGSNYPCDSPDAIETAAIQVADSAADLTKFTRIALFFPESSCPGYAGLDTVGCTTVTSPSRGNFQASVGWFPQRPDYVATNVILYAHELGHGLGMAHSNSDDYGTLALGPVDTSGTTVEYGDPFTLMGYPYNGYGPSGHYAAQHKAQVLHWLNAGDYQEVTSTGTFTVAPLEATSGLRALRILRDPITSAWLWLEYRQPLDDVDGGLPSFASSNVFAGALIHYEDPELDSLHTYLLDFAPSAAPNNFMKAPALVPGKPWSDPYSPLTLAVNSAGPTGLSVSVGYDPSCAALSLTASAFTSSAGTGTLTITAGSTCSWTVTSPVGWLTFPGAVSGQGNGAVTFVVAANPLPTERTAYISAQRQSIRILQAAAGSPSVTGLSPNYGTGATGQFTFQFADPAGYTDINYAYVIFDGAPGCILQVLMPWHLGHAGVILVSDSGNQILPALSLDAAGASVSNSQCTAYATGSSVTGSGTSAQVTLQLGFSPAYAGAHRVSASIVGSSNILAPYLPVGTWTVPLSGNVPAINKGGVVPIFSAVNTIAPGEWISIYGTNLAPSGSATWNGNFQSSTSLAGVSVTINGKPAYISSVTKGVGAAPDQINLEAPDDTTAGPVQVVLTNSLGVCNATVTLAAVAPSFSLLDSKHVAGLILTDGTGSYGNGTYDIAGPTGAFAYTTRPVKTGETLVLYGTGFGPTNPSVPAGVYFAGAARATGDITVTIGGVAAKVGFAGISYTGQYQFNVVMPGVPSGEQPLVAAVGGVSTPANVVVTAQ